MFEENDDRGGWRAQSDDLSLAFILSIKKSLDKFQVPEPHTRGLEGGEGLFPRHKCLLEWWIEL